MDYFRTDCIKSYFEIVALVNKGNKAVNEQTEAKFFIVDNRLYLGIDEKQKALVNRFVNNHWYSTEESAHENLEYFISRILNKNHIKSGNVNGLIKAELFKLSE